MTGAGFGLIVRSAGSGFSQQGSEALHNSTTKVVL